MDTKELLRIARQVAAEHGWKTADFKTLQDVPAPILAEAKKRLEREHEVSKKIFE